MEHLSFRLPVYSMQVDVPLLGALNMNDGAVDRPPSHRFIHQYASCSPVDVGAVDSARLPARSTSYEMQSGS